MTHPPMTENPEMTNILRENLAKLKAKVFKEDTEAAPKRRKTQDEYSHWSTSFTKEFLGLSLKEAYDVILQMELNCHGLYYFNSIDFIHASSFRSTMITIMKVFSDFRPFMAEGRAGHKIMPTKQLIGQNRILAECVSKNNAHTPHDYYLHFFNEFQVV